MEFNVFQTASGTLKKVTTDGNGDETVSNSYGVNLDPVFGFKDTFDSNGNNVRGMKTILTSVSLEDDFDFTHYKWKLEYNGKDYDIMSPVPFYTIGTNDLEHIEVMLR
jgi:hypothetical protein